VDGPRTLVRSSHSLEATPDGSLILIAEARQRGARRSHPAPFVDGYDGVSTPDAMSPSIPTSTSKISASE